jgi:hypothetical protein
MKTHKNFTAMCHGKKRPKIFPKANQTNEKTKTEAVTQNSEDDQRVIHSQRKHIKQIQPCVRGKNDPKFFRKPMKPRKKQMQNPKTSQNEKS